MIRHMVNVCPDDPATLTNELDTLAQSGSRILTVLWLPQRVDVDQQGAIEGRGPFAIVSQKEVAL